MRFIEARRASEECGSKLLENTFLAGASGFDDTALSAHLDMKVG